MFLRAYGNIENKSKVTSPLPVLPIPFPRGCQSGTYIPKLSKLSLPSHMHM